MRKFAERLNAMSEEKQQYALELLPMHLAQAEQKEALEDVLTDYQFLQAKLNLLGVSALIRDFELSNDNDLWLVRQALELSWHILVRDSSALASQLVGRLSLYGYTPKIRQLIDSIKPNYSWVRPLLATHNQPGSLLRRTLSGHSKAVTCCTFMPDSNLIISGSADGTLKIWDLYTNQEHLTLSGHMGGITCCSVSPTGQYVVSGSSDHTLKMWNVGTGLEMLTLHGHTQPVTCCSISPDSNFILSGSDDNTVILWDCVNGDKVHVLTGHSSSISTCAFNKSGEMIFSGSDNGEIKGWTSTDGNPLGTLTFNDESCFTIDPSANMIITVEEDFMQGDPHIKVRDMEGTRLFELARQNTAITQCTISLDGRYIASAARDHTLFVWDGTNGNQCFYLFYPSDVLSCAISPDNRFVVSGYEDGSLKLWDISSSPKNFDMRLRPHGNIVTGCTISQDGKIIITSSRDQESSLVRWGEELHIMSMGRISTGLHSCALSPNGKYLVMFATNAVVLNATTFDTVIDLKLKQWPVCCVFNSESDRILVADIDGEVTIRDVITGKILHTYNFGGYHEIACCAIDTRNDIVVIALEHSIVAQSIEGQTKFILEGHAGMVSSVKISPQGDYIVSTSGARAGWAFEYPEFSPNTDSTLIVWDAMSGEKLFVLSGHSAGVTDCSISWNNKFIVSTAYDGTLKIWDSKKGTCLITYYADVPLNRCAFGLDGVVIAGDIEGYVHFVQIFGVDFELPSNKYIEALRLNLEEYQQRAVCIGAASDNENRLKNTAYFRQLSDIERDIELYKTILDRYPLLSRAHVIIGGGYMEQGKIALAKLEFIMAEKIDPVLAPRMIQNIRSGVRLNIAREAESQEEYQQALEAYNDAVEGSPNPANDHLKRAQILANLKRHQEALIAYNCALESEEGRKATVYRKRGVIYMLLGEDMLGLFDFVRASEMALRDYDIDLELRMAVFSALVKGRSILEILSRFPQLCSGEFVDEFEHIEYEISEASKKHFEKLLHKLENIVLNRQEYMQLGFHEYLLGLSFLGLWRSNVRDYLKSSLKHSRAGHSIRAIIASNNTLKIDPSQAGVYLLRAYAYQRAGVYKEAIYDYSSFIRHKETAYAYQMRGECFQRLEFFSEAVLDYRNSLEIDPHNKVVHKNLGLSYRCLNRHREALFHLRMALELGEKEVEDAVEIMEDMVKNPLAQALNALAYVHSKEELASVVNKYPILFDPDMIETIKQMRRSKDKRLYTRVQWLEEISRADLNN